jgi:hypothetical protein
MNTDSESANRQVIHLFLKHTEKHYYFGSISSMFSHFTSKQLGVAAQSLYNRWKGDMWENDNIILRKGRLINKKKKN